MARKAITKLNDYKLKPQYSDTVVNVYPNITTIPLNPNHIYIANSVLGGSYLDTKNKPNYLRAPISSNIVTVVGEEFPLYLVFALGKDDFGEVVNAIICIESDFYVEVPQVSGGYYIYAEYNYGQIIFGYSNKTDITYSKDAPTDPVEGEYWFTYEDNCMYIYDGLNWVWINRIILGWVGVGNDGYIYSLTTFPFHYGFAKFNPEYIYTDVTGEAFLITNYEEWIDNPIVLEAVFRSEATMNVVVSDETVKYALVDSDLVTDMIIYFDRAYRQLLCGFNSFDYNTFSNWVECIKGGLEASPVEEEFVNMLFDRVKYKMIIWDSPVLEKTIRDNNDVIEYLHNNYSQLFSYTAYIHNYSYQTVTTNKIFSTSYASTTGGTCRGVRYYVNFQDGITGTTMSNCNYSKGRSFNTVQMQSQAYASPSTRTFSIYGIKMDE